MNKKLGFVMFPVLLGIGLLLIGGGVGLAVQYSNHKEVGEEQPVVPETIVLNDIETPEAAVNSAEVMPEPSVVEDVQQNQTETASVIYSVTPQQNQVAEGQVNKDLTEKIVTPVVDEVEANMVQPTYTDAQVFAYNKIKADSGRLDVILLEAEKIIDRVESTNKDALAACKATYKTEVSSVESRWESDLKYYEQQEDWYNSNSGLYELVGTSADNNRYLQEIYDEIKERKEGGLEYAKSRYESCNDSNRLDTTNSKELDSILSKQKEILSGLNKENSESRLDGMLELLVRADKLLANLKTPLFMW